MIQRGELIVCIDDTLPTNPEDAANFSRWISNGEYYTVRDTIDMPDGITGLYLEEVVGNKALCLESGEIIEYNFDSRRFKKVGGTE
jgi:hypothetical protein